MNERIKELYNQARYEVSIRDGMLTPGEVRDKFAELIIQECYESCKSQVLDKETADTNELTYNDAVGDCAIGLLQHFEMME